MMGDVEAPDTAITAGAGVEVTTADDGVVRTLSGEEGTVTEVTEISYCGPMVSSFTGACIGLLVLLLLERSTMVRAEKFHTLAREQYGSRKGNSAIDYCINKRLTFDIIRQKRIPGAHLASVRQNCPLDGIISHASNWCPSRADRLYVQHPPRGNTDYSSRQRRKQANTVFLAPDGITTINLTLY